jgi:hypothetical protein
VGSMRWKHATVGLALLAVVALTGACAQRVSIGVNGSQGNAPVEFSEISGNGRFVVFTSRASNLTHGDTNGGQARPGRRYDAVGQPGQRASGLRSTGRHVR